MTLLKHYADMVYFTLIKVKLNVNRNNIVNLDIRVAYFNITIATIDNL